MHEIIKRAKKQHRRTINWFTVSLYNKSPNCIRKMALFLISIITRLLVKNKYNKFLIFAQGRTGSTLLTDLLHSNSNIFMFGEIFNKRVIRNVKNPVRYANTLASIQFRSSIVGFKVKLYHFLKEQNVDVTETLKQFEADGWKIIYLERKNKLEQSLSNMIAKRRGSFHNTSNNNESVIKDLVFDLSYDDLIRKIERREKYTEQEYEALKKVKYLHITYEDDLLDSQKHQQTADKIFNYIGVPSVPVSSKFKKINNKPKNELIKNWEELETKLKMSKYAKYL